MPKDFIRETTRKTVVTERTIELNRNDIRDLLVQTGVIAPLDTSDHFDVRITVPTGADWSGMNLDLDFCPAIVTITRRTETVE